MSKRRAILVAVLLLASGICRADYPATQLFTLNPCGGQQGTVVEVNILQGADLEGVNDLRFSHPGIVAKPKLADPPIYGGPAEQVTGRFLVTIGADVPPGIYDVRAVGRFGISNPRAFTVGDLPEVAEEPGNNQPDKAMRLGLDSVVSGVVVAGQSDYFQFTAKAGQRILIEACAQQIDSRLDATLLLRDASGREIARDVSAVRRDPLLDVTMPADGQYTVAIFDAVYAGGNEYFYRLGVRTGPYIDFIMPPVGAPGETVSCTVFGRNLPGGVAVPNMNIKGRPLESLVVPIRFPEVTAKTELPSGPLLSSREATFNGFAFRLASPHGSSNPYRLGFASSPVVVASATADPAKSPVPRKLNVPCEYVGRFERNRVESLDFTAKKGDVYVLEVWSQRLGLPTDPVLVVQRVSVDAKKQVQISDIAEVDDDGPETAGTPFSVVSGDPSYRLLVPADGDYRVTVRDLNQSRVDPRRLYRLIIRRPQPGFSLVAATSYAIPGTPAKEIRFTVPALRRGGAEMIEVLALRRDGFTGPIEVTAEGLPPGVACPAVVIGSAQTSVPLVFTTSVDAAAWTGSIRIIGRASFDGKDTMVPARAGVATWPTEKVRAGQPVPAVTSRVAQDFMLSVSGNETAPLLVSLSDGKPVAMSRGGKLSIPVKFARQANFKEKEAVTLIPIGLPKTIKAANAVIATGASEGKLTLEIGADQVPGVLSFQVQAVPKFAYRRDEAGAKAAAETKQKLAALITELAAAAKAAEQAKKPGDKPTEEAAALAQRKLKAASDAKVVADKRAADLAKAAELKEISLFLPSTVCRLEVTPAPITLGIPGAAAVVERGKKAEIPVVVTRLYDYADTVALDVIVPPGLKGIQAAATTVGKGSTESKLTFTTTADATTGSHTLTVRAKLKFNNLPLELTENMTITIR
jgi:hypothetical protein